jgi:hypothetical protein
MNTNQTTIEAESNDNLSLIRHRLALAVKDGNAMVAEIYEDVCAELRTRKVFV